MLVQIKADRIGLLKTQPFAQLVFTEVNGNRTFSTLVGENEAKAIMLALKSEKQQQPLTHDTMRNIITALDGKLQQVLITTNKQALEIRAELHIRSGEDTLVIPARISDATALALHCQCAIFIKGDMLNALTGTKEELPQVPKDGKDDLSKYTYNELEQTLQELLKIEDYETAIRVRDELNARNVF